MSKDIDAKENEIISEDMGDVKSIAMAYAKYLRDKGLKPGDATFAEPEDLGLDPSEGIKEPAEIDFEFASEPAAEAAEAPGSPSKKKTFTLRRFPGQIKIKPYEESKKGLGFLSACLDGIDRLQSRIDEKAVSAGKDFAISAHRITSTYRGSSRIIGLALLGIVIAASVILIIFDRFTVYEYAYNGKVLGYVKEQEEVSEVLDIAGRKLTENSNSSLDIEFIPNQNVTFNLVDASNKSLDDADTAVNKLVYMTDIETEAYGIYDDGELVTIVKNEDEANSLIDRALNVLSRPDSGMELVSAEYDNTLESKPLNVLLTSVKDNTSALQQMTEGGQMEIYHIVEEGETLESLMEDYAVEAGNIYDNSNSEVAEEIVTGDKVCIHREAKPVSVTMVEQGRLRETVEFKTVKKETDQYYKGDTVVEQEGSNGIRIFEGSITKKSGEETDRKEVSSEVIRPVQDKIILVGTAERPKSAPTGTYAMPLHDRFNYSSPFGGRWGRLHAGVDLACSTGTPIYASDGGTIVRASYYGGYGNCVEIDHGGGRLTRYAHCSKILVNAGEKVYQGQQIALVGNTGNSYGSHLHFEIRINGEAIDPAPKLGL